MALTRRPNEADPARGREDVEPARAHSGGLPDGTGASRGQRSPRPDAHPPSSIHPAAGVRFWDDDSQGRSPLPGNTLKLTAFSSVAAGTRLAEAGAGHDRPARRREELQDRWRPHLGAPAHHPGHRRGRVRHLHGAVGRGQVHAAVDPGDAGRRLAGRIPAVRPRGAPAAAQGARGAEQEAHRLRVPAVPPAGRPDRGREPGGAAVLPRPARLGAQGPRGRRARPLPDRRARRTCTPASCRAASSSWWRWPAR